MIRFSLYLSIRTGNKKQNELPQNFIIAGFFADFHI